MPLAFVRRRRQAALHSPGPGAGLCSPGGIHKISVPFDGSADYWFNDTMLGDTALGISDVFLNNPEVEEFFNSTKGAL